MLDPALLAGRPRYQRVMEGRVDNTHDDAFTHTVRLTDDDRSLEVAVVALPSPTYAVREARLTPLAGRVGGSLPPAFARLAGSEMVGGLTRRVAELLGTDDGATLAVDATIEVARLARQVAKLPRAIAERATGDPLACWMLDTTGWVDLPNSCFTYSGAGRAMFGTSTIATPMVADLYSPRPGQPRVFERRKVAQLERAGDRLRLFHSMHDNVHGFELRCEIDLASGTIVQAEHVTPRLPYLGVCSEPQRRFASLIGERVDRELRKRIQGILGGEAGCAQLYDLTADLLKLLG
jgi:Protein of unknown function (DUF2889)